MNCSPSSTPSWASVSGPAPKNFPFHARTHMVPGAAKPLGAAANTASFNRFRVQEASATTEKLVSPLTFLMRNVKGRGSCSFAFASASAFALRSASALAFCSASALAFCSACALAARSASTLAWTSGCGANSAKAGKRCATTRCASKPSCTWPNWVGWNMLKSHMERSKFTAPKLTRNRSKASTSSKKTHLESGCPVLNFSTSSDQRSWSAEAWTSMANLGGSPGLMPKSSSFP
mmetsp:Transcript_37808/g.80355  ORF Transcript_37808/g.80355 Transcript_37808/m.80355 type:complete len:234 (+) Transcript_37808:129-830(+)